MRREMSPCGTTAAYKRHRKAGEKPCGPCVDAYREQSRSWYSQRIRSQAGLVFPTLSADTFADAICHQEGPDLWEPARDEERPKDARARWREAAELCELCPALGACARLADAQSVLAGVWAARVPRISGERIQGDLTRCGTRAGYQQHMRVGEGACDACSQAHRAYMREYMRGRSR